MTPPPTTDEPDDPAVLQRAVDRLNQAVQSLSTSLQFTVDAATGVTVVKVTDAQTGEVVRQMPAEEVLAIARNLDRLRGLLICTDA